MYFKKVDYGATEYSGDLHDANSNFQPQPTNSAFKVLIHSMGCLEQLTYTQVNNKTL